jgi:CheY-like chemotaxis protein
MALERFHYVVIDDNKLDHFIAKKVIENVGNAASYHQFDSAETALDFLKDYSFADGIRLFIFIDIYMPVTDGFEFVEILSRTIPLYNLNAHCHLCFLSSSINNEDLVKVKSLNISADFLSKPLLTEGFQNYLEKIKTPASHSHH